MVVAIAARAGTAAVALSKDRDEGSSADALSKSATTLAHIGGVLERQRVATGCDGGKADAKWRDDAGEDGTVCTVVEVSICPTHVSLYIDIYIYNTDVVSLSSRGLDSRGLRHTSATTVYNRS